MIGNFNGVGHFEATFRLKAYVSRQNLWTIRWGMAILQPCRWKFSHTKICSRLYSIGIKFYLKNKKIAFEPPFGELRGNVRTAFIARWKARGRLCIRHNWTFLAISYSWDVISGNLLKSAFFEEGWVTLSVNFRRKRASSTTRDCPFMWCQNIRSALFGFVTKHACDKRTDGQNYDSQDRASVAVSRGKNHWIKAAKQ